MSPNVTASRCRQTASNGHPPISGVTGSRTGQKYLTNSIKPPRFACLARSRRLLISLSTFASAAFRLRGSDSHEEINKLVVGDIVERRVTDMEFSGQDGGDDLQVLVGFFFADGLYDGNAVNFEVGVHGFEEGFGELVTRALGASEGVSDLAFFGWSEVGVLRPHT